MSPQRAFEILGLPPGSAADAIKRAYREQAKKHHPDLNGGEAKAEESFRRIQAAYECLCGRNQPMPATQTSGPISAGRSGQVLTLARTRYSSFACSWTARVSR